MKKVSIKDHIYREYDIRGIVGLDLTPDVYYTFGLGYGSFLQDQGFTEVILGKDNRLSSNLLTSSLTQGLLESGIDIIDLGLVTTPMVNAARYILKNDASLMVTASHNPKEYNGIKMSYDHYGQAYGDKIIKVRDYIKKNKFKSGQGTIKHYDIKEEYLKAIKDSIDIDRKLKVVVDCGNGTGSIIAREMYEMFNLELEPLYCESDGNFPNHHPDPNVEENMRDLEKKVKELHYDLGIGIDGDADRVAIVDNEGNYLTTDLYLILMSRYLKPNKVLFDVKMSKTLKEELEKLNIKPVMYKTGAALLNTKMQQDGFLMGGEYSGHIFYHDKWFGFDDGLYNGLRIVEMLSKTDKKITQLLEGVKRYPNEYLNYPVTEDNKFQIVEEVKKYVKEKGYHYNDIDGVRVEQDDSITLVRASNTSPNLTLSFEANTEEKKEQIKKEFINIIDDIVGSL